VKVLLRNEKTFSSVAMTKSVQILLSIAIHFTIKFGGWMSRQLSLNGSLEETIYVRKPDEFIERRKEHLLCKLNKSINGF
jgi:hypothetical protein